MRSSGPVCIVRNNLEGGIDSTWDRGILLAVAFAEFCHKPRDRVREALNCLPPATGTLPRGFEKRSELMHSIHCDDWRYFLTDCSLDNCLHELPSEFIWQCEADDVVRPANKVHGPVIPDVTRAFYFDP